jgi:hypothetical protein
MKNDANRVLGRLLAVEDVEREGAAATTSLGDSRPDFDSRPIIDRLPAVDGAFDGTAAR